MVVRGEIKLSVVITARQGVGGGGGGGGPAAAAACRLPQAGL